MNDAVVERFQDMTAGLADATEKRVLELWQMFQRGEITDGELRMMIAVLIGRANATAVGLADVNLSAQIEALTGSPAPPTGIAPTDDVARLLIAVETIQYATDADPEMQLTRLARAEPISTAQRTTIQAMGSHDLVAGWTRQMDGDPCQLCRWWWREGRVWPKDHPFQRHPGCNCQPRIVLRQKIRSTEYTRRLHNAR